MKMCNFGFLFPNHEIYVNTGCREALCNGVPVICFQCSVAMDCNLPHCSLALVSGRSGFFTIFTSLICSCTNYNVHT